MTTNTNTGFRGFACCGIAATAIFSAHAMAGDAQFINVFDKSKMKDSVPGAMMAELVGRNISVETFFIAGGTAPLSKGKYHYHPEEHVWFQFTGESQYEIKLNDQKTIRYDAGAGEMWHIPADQMHRGGHGAEDHFMAMVSTPARASTVAEQAPDKRCYIAAPTECTKAPPRIPTRDLYDKFVFADLKTSQVKKGIRVRQGKLGEGAGLGQEALVFRKNAKPTETLSARKPPAEEVAIVYQGRVKITGCGETRELVRGDIFYCPGALTYAGLGKEDSQVLRVFAPANPDFFIAKP